MATTYTYDDFLTKATELGMLDSMSDADKKLAESNPAAGMSILQYRSDYQNATTDEAKALAHAGAESVRKQYGGYIGGDDGNGYYLEGASPADYEKQEEAPTYESEYSDEKESALDAILNREDYQSSYADQIQEVLNSIADTDSFSYDASTDPVYQAYAKQYRREGERAVADTLGSTAALTGGIPSSYAVTAANQAGDYYATQLSDKLPELEDAAYDRYVDQKTLAQNAYEALSDADDTEYQRYIDALGLDYDDLNAIISLDEADYEKFKDQLSQYNTDRDFDYTQWLDELYYNSEQKSTAAEQSMTEEELAADQEQTAYENELEEALYAAEYLGNYTLLKKLLGLA